MRAATVSTSVHGHGFAPASLAMVMAEQGQQMNAAAELRDRIKELKANRPSGGGTRGP